MPRSAVNLAGAAICLVIVTGAVHGQAVDRQAVLAPVILTGEGETGATPLRGLVPRVSATGTKTDTPLVGTPQSVTVIGTEQMSARGATTVGGAQAYSAGLATGTADTQTRYDAVTMRGFGGFASNSNFADYLDGLKLMRDGRIGTQVDPWLLEQVEALRGPSSVLFGAASPGGFVNMVSKQPVDEPLRHVRLTFGNHRRVETAFDFGGEVQGRDDLSYRLTGLARRASSFIDLQEDERIALAGALRGRPARSEAV